MLCMFDEKPTNVKKQIRREKSRNAARHRRNKESKMFDEITDMLPMPHDLVSNLDRSSIMRLVNSFIRLRQSLIKDPANPYTLAKEDLTVKQEVLADNSQVSSDDFVNALNGFLFVLSSDFDILFVSENVKGYLGLSKFDLVGQSVLSFVHEGDHEEVRECFNDTKEIQSRRSFFLRMKSTLTVSGKSINLKSAAYKVLQCTGFRENAKGDDGGLFVVQAEPIPHPSNIEHFMDSKTFLTQHTPDMKFSYCDQSITELLGYHESDMLGKSFYEYCHVLDIKPIEDFFHKLYRINQIETTQYRFLAKTGGYHWVVTQATVIPCPKKQKPQCIVCVHFVLSEPVLRHNVFSVDQQDCTGLMSYVDDKEEAEVEKAYLENSLSEIAIAPPSLPMEDPAYNECRVVPLEFSDLDDNDGLIECKIVPLQFTDMDENDDFLSEDMFNNAPCIGDPWMVPLPEKERLEDLFDVGLDSGNNQHGSEVASRLEGQQQQQQGGKFMSRMRVDSPPGYTPTSILLQQQQPIASKTQQHQLNHDRYRSSPSSPGDSAYCGSPPGVLDDPLGAPIGGPRSLARDLGRHQRFQHVSLCGDDFGEHLANLKRGYVTAYTSPDPGQSCARKRNVAPPPPGSPAGAFPHVAKRRCFERAVVDPDLQKRGACQDQRPLHQMVNVLLQPGNGYGYPQDNRENNEGDDLLRSLLQPEMNTQNELHHPSNVGINLLPELSLHDCEVNAPLLIGAFPLGPDCLHALDEVSAL